MELTESEKKLLERYRADKKKRRKKIVQLLLCLFVVFVLGFAGYQGYQRYLGTVKIEEEKKAKIDKVKPVLELTHEKVEIVQGEAFDYKKFIRSATDKKDGDLTEKVTYTEIDTSVVGEAIVTYSVKDKAGNEATAKLKVVVKEKEENKDTSKQEAPIQQEQPAVQNETPAVSEPVPAPAPSKPVQQPETRYFMFRDGYTMENVSSACSNALMSSGRAGACVPMQDESGIYIGMRLDLY